ncbi:ABC transporter substrate-binding protein [Rhodococcus erythropolis]|uniref:ABC transporter substrate-binding protein n=1 Tax=Rhodococcus erythropolis TaxID=1833 RepID=UPI00038F3C44|nr:ABC transporter substrate-binding protein [Rhodococcus erythropolis]ERB50239.1 ABC transporter substrate-binding protein [Rhodococcus sp. P27]MDJ0404196.1 ABC transporter substrate-binding protein [Rhodococcus erythropolis]
MPSARAAAEKESAYMYGTICESTTSELVDQLSRRGFFGVGAVAAAAILAGCSTTSDAADAGEQREVINALGTTTISGKPERIVVASDFTDLEFLLSLGVHPVAYGNTGAWDRGALPWQSTAGIADLESFDTTGEISPEIIARYSPDLIVGMKTYLEPAAERLSQIAPVIALDWTTSWRDGVATVGQAAFVDEAAAAAIARTDALISDTAASLNGLGGKTIMIGSMYGDQLYVQGDASAPGVLLRELGLNYRGYNAEQMTALSMEQAEVLAPADILLSLASDQEATTRLENFAVFQNLPAVKARAYAPVELLLSNAFVDNFGPLSAPYALPQLAEVLTGLAAGQGKQLP